MKLFRLSTILSIAGAVSAGALLFWTSQSVQREEDRLAALQESVVNEQQSIRVLRAEWDYLNRPERLEALAAEYLGLSSSAAAFSVGGEVSDLPTVMIPALPGRKPVMMAQPAVMSVPAAPELPSGPPQALPQGHSNFQQLLETLNENEEGGAP